MVNNQRKDVAGRPISKVNRISKSRLILNVKVIRGVALYILLMIGAVVAIGPIVWGISTSLKNRGEVFIYPPELIPSQIRWANFTDLFDLIPFFRAVVNSIVVSVGVTFGVLAVSSLAAYAFARLSFRGRNKIFFAYIVTLMIPFHVILIPLFIEMRIFRLSDTLTGVIMAWLFFPFGIFLLRQFFLTIPVELEDAARIDGCSSFWIYFSIILPLTKSVHATLAIILFMWSWNDFLWPLVMLNTETKHTLPVALAYLQGFYGTNWPLVMAGAVTSIIPMLIVFLFLSRYIVKGIVLTGLKG